MITYQKNPEDVDWAALRQRLIADNFDNGRNLAQYETSFRNSRFIFAYDGDEVVGKARALTDGVCNAYIVDVWTYSPYRNQGIASEMLRRLEEDLQGQHVYLFTDDAVGFYQKQGYKIWDVGLGKVVGAWLVNTPD
jgi:predicted GNAT family acetyltransferase